MYKTVRGNPYADMGYNTGGLDYDDNNYLSANYI